jgi:hypothetical protein
MYQVSVKLARGHTYTSNLDWSALLCHVVYPDNKAINTSKTLANNYKTIMSHNQEHHNQTVHHHIIETDDEWT